MSDPTLPRLSPRDELAQRTAEALARHHARLFTDAVLDTVLPPSKQPPTGEASPEAEATLHQLLGELGGTVAPEVRAHTVRSVKSCRAVEGTIIDVTAHASGLMPPELRCCMPHSMSVDAKSRAQQMVGRYNLVTWLAYFTFESDIDFSRFDGDDWAAWRITTSAGRAEWELFASTLAYEEPPAIAGRSSPVGARATVAAPSGRVSAS